MKVCERCGEEISTGDGENLCAACDEENDNGRMPYDSKKERRRESARIRRKERDEVMRSLGLKKVRGALGGTYWE